MPSFLSLFKSKQRAKSAPPASRHIWPGRHRSQSAVLHLAHDSQPDETSEEVQPAKTTDNDDNATDTRSFHESDEEINTLDNGSPLERQVSNAVRCSHKSNEGSDHSRSQNGSQRKSQPGTKRLEGFMARFRMTRSQDRSSASELLTQSIPQDAARDATTTDPVKKDIPPRDSSTHVSEHGLETQEQNRNVSAQTVQSQDSNQTTTTVFRHPSQPIAMPIDELQDEAFWSSLLNFRTTSPTAHTVEPSDPFSDGKDIEPQNHQPAVSSHYSGDRSQRQSETSGHTSTHTQVDSECQRSSAHQRSSKSHSSHSTPPPNGTRVSSVSSHSSRGSRLSRVDPSRAAMAFEVLATSMRLAITLREDESSVDKPDESQNAEEDGEIGRRRRFGRVPRYYLPTWRTQLPYSASRPGARAFAATSMYCSDDYVSSKIRFVALSLHLRLRHSLSQLTRVPAAPHSASLFVEPGDMKAATRLYNHFASQVLLAERDAHRIAMTMRVIAIPHIDTESSSMAVLSVGWVFVELLAGLPNGILGSVHLYRVVHRIFLAATANPGRVRLITLAIMALTSEMECAMICAVCGFLTGLLQATGRVREGPTQPQTPGNPVRPVASSLQPDGLARVFGPLLIGRRRNRSAQRPVEQEIEEERIMLFLLENWLGICRQLWEWTGRPAPGLGGRG
ncbi:hypothetical protein N7478_004932 [Penicillium angulare]|uniref:uncharacterized protein n=1 Tax=Penicillium angulare TaxID=116970 RepID=UPI002541E528|nr:uncharacterized protein N7478_004932 [Penicillium angulare]KAJ5279560.1 hypothetical protein N7478_004932 [Penicillium angulare]